MRLQCNKDWCDPSPPLTKTYTMGIAQGVAIILMYIVNIFVIFWYYKNNKYTYCLLAILLLGLFLRLFCSLDANLHQWDERYHALVAKNMIESPFAPKLFREPILGYDYKDWSKNHIWLHKQPFSLWTMAIAISVFGATAFSVRIPSIIFSTLSICLTYLIGKRLFNAKIGLWASFFQAINGFVIEVASGRVATDHVDTAFMLLIQCSIFFSITYKPHKKYTAIIIGIFSGLSVLCKWLPGLLCIPLFLYYHFTYEKIKDLLVSICTIIAVSLLVFLPWQIYCNIYFPIEYGWEQHYNWLHFTNDIEDHGKPWWFHIDQSRIIWNELIYYVFGWFLFRVWAEKERNLLLILIWILIPYVFFSIAVTKMVGYTLPAAPAIFILMGYFISNALQTSSRFQKMICWIVIGLALRYSIERVKPFKLDEKPSETIEYVLKSDLNDKKSVIFKANDYIALMFFTDVIATDIDPTEAAVNNLISNGFHLFTLDNNRLEKFDEKHINN